MISHRLINSKTDCIITFIPLYFNVSIVVKYCIVLYHFIIMHKSITSTAVAVTINNFLTHKTVSYHHLIATLLLYAKLYYNLLYYTLLI